MFFAVYLVARSSTTLKRAFSTSPSMLTTRSIVPPTWKERLLSLHIQTVSTVGLMMFQIDSGRRSFMTKLGPDPLCRMVSNLLVHLPENRMFV